MPDARYFDQDKIRTVFVHPPIPYRGNDWCAYFDGQEESSHYGWGKTEKAAIDDLNQHYGVPTHCHICGQPNNGLAACAKGGCPIGGDQ